MFNTKISKWIPVPRFREDKFRGNDILNTEEDDNMIRKAFVMSVFEGREAEYKKRHNPIWSDLERTLKAHGVHNYSIFLHPETRQLFAYVEIEDEARWNAIAQTESCKRWWAYMKDIMPPNPDNSPVSLELREVFHLD